MSPFIARLVSVSAVLLSVASTSSVLAAEPGDGIVGDWMTANGQAKIHFGNEGGTYVGRVAWLKMQQDTGKPVLDTKNPDERLRGRQMIGQAIVWGMKFDGASGYEGGHCYDPESGKTYQGKATLENANHLALRGYVGIPLFGRSETWQERPPERAPRSPRLVFWRSPQCRAVEARRVPGRNDPCRSPERPHRADTKIPWR